MPFGGQGGQFPDGVDVAGPAGSGEATRLSTGMPAAGCRILPTYDYQLGNMYGFSFYVA
jgi:hypothetical protein